MHETPIMINDGPRQLNCLIESDSFVFPVTVGHDHVVGNLKVVIKGMRELGVLKNVDPQALELWKVNIGLKPHDRGSLRNLKLEQNSEGVEELMPWNSVGEYWPDKPPNKHLHIIVKAPTSPRPFDSLILPAPSNVAPRRDIVAALYQRLKKYAFIQVRGTPASGKSVLARLFADHISRQDPDVHIVYVNGWPRKDEKQSGNYRTYLKQRGWVDEHKKTVFIFDEAQLTYQDEELWSDFFKSIDGKEPRRAIIFVSYGSPTSESHYDITEPTPIIINDYQRVTLRHVAHDDDLPPAGLLFTRSELDDLIIKQYPSSVFYFHPSFFDALFNITNGHVGAIQDFITIIVADNSYRKVNRAAGRLYSWNSFLAGISPRELLQKLETSASIFRRGLPSNRELQAPAIATVFSAVLRNNVVLEDDFIADDEKTALQKCFHKGWLHTDKLGDIGLPDDVGYVFASPLHRWYVEWKLSDNLPPTQQFQANSLLDFVINAIREFSPQLLSAERRTGPSSIQRPPEAQYQDEFYRCCYNISKGSLRTFPEYGTAKGRVDFYVPAKRWGIELLRDGNQLANHCGRFSKTGAYMTTLAISDYIILDYRVTHPRTTNPHMPKLFHVVFEDDFEHVRILDNKHCVIRDGEFQLLRSS